MATGPSIVSHDFGGLGRAALCAHGAGLCGAMFSPLANELTSSMRLQSVDLRGHGLSGQEPIESNCWHTTATDLLRVVEALDLNAPIGIGHSFGATAQLLAEAKRPGTFSWIYGYEPVLLTEAEASSAAHARRIESTRHRRSTFTSREEALQHYRHRGVLGECTEEALFAYVHDALRERNDGSFELVLSPNDEALIYQYAARKELVDFTSIRCPVVIAHGSDSDQGGRHFAERVYGLIANARLEIIEGSRHLGPMGNPKAVAASIIRSNEWAES